MALSCLHLVNALPRKTVAVAGAHDLEALKAVAQALGLAHFILVGDTQKSGYWPKK